MNELANVTCYRQDAAECDEEDFSCELCGQTMCFGHSRDVFFSGSDEGLRICDGCWAKAEQRKRVM